MVAVANVFGINSSNPTGADTCSNFPKLSDHGFGPLSAPPV
jgi:hypothetical protein